MTQRMTDTLSSLEARRAEIKLENADKREDSQRHMAWIALLSMITYPCFFLIASAMEMAGVVSALEGIAPTFFVSVAAIVAAFYGKEAYTKSRTVDQVVK